MQIVRGTQFVNTAVRLGGDRAAAVALDADLTNAEAQIEALLAKGDIDGAAMLADAYEAQILAAHGLSA